MQVVFNALKLVLLFLYLLFRLLFKWSSPWEMTRAQNIQTKPKKAVSNLITMSAASV